MPYEGHSQSLYCIIYTAKRKTLDQSDCPNHGTKCAGLIAAADNNEVCIAGVAHGSRIGGIRMLDGTIYDSIEAKTLSENRDKIDIFSLSWGPGKSFPVTEYLHVTHSKNNR